jgi:formylglycine-generating enzyme
MKPYWSSISAFCISFQFAKVVSWQPVLYAGNVWELCSDWYDYNYYKSLQGITLLNPKGTSKSFDSDEPLTPKRSLRGGSYLCNDSYCSGYRVARRMKRSPDTGLEHTGFSYVRMRDKNPSLI